jgi:GDP-D-glucose phosphorylase
LKRRQPEKFESITPSFNENKFNFNKIDEREILMVKEINGSPVLFLINNSPLTKYHLLMVPEVTANQPQVMTLPCLELGLEVMRNCSDKAIRIGYNSPGALASVNHLHLHLLHVERELYVEVIVSSNMMVIPC